MPIQNRTIRERAEIKLAGMKGVRKPYEDDWREINRLALPARAEHLQTGALRRRANMSKQDTAGRIAGRTLVNGMATGLSSSSQPWFEIGPPDPDLGDYQPVKEWLFYVQREIYGFFSATNYYDAGKISYAQLGHMGVGASLALEHPQYLGVYHAFEVGEYWIAQDEGLRIDTLYRRPVLTVDQMVASFGDKVTARVRDAYDKGDVQMLVPCIHAIEANKTKDESFYSITAKPYRSIWWEEGNDKKDDEALLRVGGYDSKPFTAPRWETSGAQVYSDTSPGFDALPDLRELEWSARRYGRAMDNLVKPALNIPASLSQTPISVDPGSLNFVSDLQGKVEPTIRPDPNVLTMIERGREFLTGRVNTLFYADLWMAITDMEGIQPKNEQELLYRNEEKLTQLGPVVDRVNIEKLELDIDRAYRILQNLGRIPPPPPELQGKPLVIKFISILARAQRAAENTQIERAARFVGFLTGMFPEAAIKFDAEQAIDEYAANAGTNPKIIRSDEVVARMKQAMEAQQKAQQMAAMAQPAADGAQAAKLLSETQVGPQDKTMLDQLLGQ